VITLMSSNFLKIVDCRVLRSIELLEAVSTVVSSKIVGSFFDRAGHRRSIFSPANGQIIVST
jgi:hypothetical protein